MNFLNAFLRGLAILPGVIQGVESFVGQGSGDQKKAAALAMVGTAINLTDAIAKKQVLNAEQFQGGLGQVIDGIVACLNASSWTKK